MWLPLIDAADAPADPLVLVKIEAGARIENTAVSGILSMKFKPWTSKTMVLCFPVGLLGGYKHVSISMNSIRLLPRGEIVSFANLAEKHPVCRGVLTDSLCSFQLKPSTDIFVCRNLPVPDPDDQHAVIDVAFLSEAAKRPDGSVQYGFPILVLPYFPQELIFEVLMPWPIASAHCLSGEHLEIASHLEHSLLARVRERRAAFPWRWISRPGASRRKFSIVLLRIEKGKKRRRMALADPLSFWMFIAFFLLLGISWYMILAGPGSKSAMQGLGPN